MGWPAAIAISISVFSICGMLTVMVYVFGKHGLK